MHTRLGRRPVRAVARLLEQLGSGWPESGRFAGRCGRHHDRWLRRIVRGFVEGQQRQQRQQRQWRRGLGRELGSRGESGGRRVLYAALRSRAEVRDGDGCLGVRPDAVHVELPVGERRAHGVDSDRALSSRLPRRDPGACIAAPRPARSTSTPPRTTVGSRWRAVRSRRKPPSTCVTRSTRRRAAPMRAPERAWIA